MQLTAPFQSLLPAVVLAASVTSDVAAHPLTQSNTLLTPSPVGQPRAFASSAGFPQFGPDDGPDFGPDDDGPNDPPFRARRSLGIKRADSESEDVVIPTPVGHPRAVATDSVDFPDFVPDDGANFNGADDDVPGLEDPDPPARRSLTLKRVPQIEVDDDEHDFEDHGAQVEGTPAQARRHVHFGRELDHDDGPCDDQHPKERRSAVRRRPSTPMPKRFPQFELDDGPDDGPDDDEPPAAGPTIAVAAPTVAVAAPTVAVFKRSVQF